MRLRASHSRNTLGRKSDRAETNNNLPADAEEKHMIPGPFTYHRPGSVADAVKLLADFGDAARPLAGGYSLVPMMKLRLATPDHLVDLHDIADLKGIERQGGRIVIGAMTTQHQLLAKNRYLK